MGGQSLFFKTYMGISRVQNLAYIIYMENTIIYMGGTLDCQKLSSHIYGDFYRNCQIPPIIYIYIVRARAFYIYIYYRASFRIVPLQGSEQVERALLQALLQVPSLVLLSSQGSRLRLLLQYR